MTNAVYLFPEKLNTNRIFHLVGEDIYDTSANRILSSHLNLLNSLVPHLREFFLQVGKLDMHPDLHGKKRYLKGIFSFHFLHEGREGGHYNPAFLFQEVTETLPPFP